MTRTPPAVQQAERITIMLSIWLLLALTGCDSVINSEVEGDWSNATPQLGLHAADVPSDNVVLFWGEACLQSIRDTGHGPPMAARTIAIVHTAMFDAWAAYDAEALGTRLGSTLRRPSVERTSVNKEAAISYAAYRALMDLFPGRSALFGALMNSLGYDPGESTMDATTAAGVGNVAAAALLAFRHQDGSNQLSGYADNSGYAPVNPPLDPSSPGLGEPIDPSRWQPLIHNGQVQRWIIPHWKDVTPFALTSADQFMPPPPAAVRSGEFHRQAQEVINMQASLTDRQKVIAEFWADGPSSEFPPGHWCTIAQYVSMRDGHTLDDDVKLFFLVANAVLDASIAAWTAKIHYDYVRPVSAIRYLKKGKKMHAWAGPGLGTQVIDGEAWVPYQVSSFWTPPFAEYVSGHSTFSMSAAIVLMRFTGSDAFGQCATFPAGWSKVEPGFAPANEVTLCWDTFTEAAEEAGMSRLYGGIHFRKGNEEGLILGRKVGEQVWEKARSYFEGTIAMPLVSNQGVWPAGT